MYVDEAGHPAPSIRIPSSWAFLFRRYGWFSVTALIGLVTWPLTFRPLNVVTVHQCHGLTSCQFSACYTHTRTHRFNGHFSRWTWVSRLTSLILLLHFSLPRPSIIDLGSCTGQTDRQTDRKRSSMHYAVALWGRGIKICGLKQHVKLIVLLRESIQC